MFLGAGEIVVVLAVALMVLGPKKMPEVARNLARFTAQLRRMADDVRSQVDDALQETPPQRPPQAQPTLPPSQEDNHASLQDGAAPAADATEHPSSGAAGDAATGAQPPKVS